VSRCARRTCYKVLCGGMIGPRSGRSRFTHRRRSEPGALCSSAACRDRLRDPSCADQVRGHGGGPPRITPHRHRRRRLGQFPAWRFVPAGYAAQGHSILLKMQQCVVSMKAAQHLPHAIQHAQPVRVHVIGGCGAVTRSDRVIRHHRPAPQLQVRPFLRTRAAVIPVQLTSRGVPRGFGLVSTDGAGGYPHKSDESDRKVWLSAANSWNLATFVLQQCRESQN